MPKSWFSIEAKSEMEAEVSIYDEIGLWGVTAKDFSAALKPHEGKRLNIRINSPGGSVTEGFAIANMLRRHKGGVSVQIDGLAASMATYIALAGTPVKMAENAFFMIHRVSGGAFGDADNLRSYVSAMEKMEANIVAAYAAKTGRDTEEIEEKMAAETWFTAQEAKEFGFVDEITDEFEAAAVASFDLKNFKNAPAALAPVDKNLTETMQAEQFTARISELENQLAEANTKHSAAAAQAQENFSKLTAALADVKAKEVEIENLKASAKTVEEAASAKAIEIAANVGVPPVSAEDLAKKNAAQTVSRAEFNKMNAKQQGEFCRNGGCITD